MDLPKDDFILKMEGINKSFANVQVLSNCRFDLKRGEVHALMGENGAGKSTLVKILTGIYHMDAGKIIYKGRSVNYKNTREAQGDGIQIVHQELNLMNHLTVGQNVFIGREGSGLFLHDAAANKKTREILSRFKLNISPEEKVGSLTVGKQQMIEIAKVISQKSDVIVFDEPTAALTDTEIDELFDVIAGLRDEGAAIIYISHRMDEVKRITDRVTVLRDGEYIGTRISKDVDISEIIQMMVGRTIYEKPKNVSAVPEGAEAVLEVKDLRSSLIKGLSFQLKKGEILGFAGLMGAGRTESARLIFGADKRTGGEILLHGKPVSIKSPYDAVKLGIGYLSEDRKRYGLAVGLSVAANMVMTSLNLFMKGIFIDDGKIHNTAAQYIDKIGIKTPSPRQMLMNLSGGNQQKVVIAKWLIRDCEILIFDEPTRGIDVGAKSEIYKLMNELAAAGKSIIMISSELPELLRMSDRILVMCEGRHTGTLDISEASQEKIMALATAAS